MAYSRSSNVKLNGVAACVPSQVVENKDYPFFKEGEYAKFVSSVGIERRRVVDPGICTSDLCFTAAEKLISELGWDKSEIDVLVFVSHTADYKLPATSCILQDRLKLPNQCMTLDISLGCSGYPHGIKVITSLLAGGEMKKGLLLAGNTQSLYASYRDRSVYPLFADAGSATAFEYCEGADEMYFDFGTDGSGFEAIIIQDGGCRNPVNEESFKVIDFGDGIFRSRLNEGMDGMDIFSFGIKTAPHSVEMLIDTFNLKKENIDYFLFHQANRFLIEQIRKKLKLPPEKVPYNLQNFGNTSCTTIPLLMVTNLKEELTQRKLHLLMCGFGVGLSWGTAALTANKVVCSDLIEF
jgi:3-oxoacyl-[acyl-carrier-protein] synthase-3